ncbi:MAG: agmatinase, partial [Calditrichaeota bacterium]
QHTAHFYQTEVEKLLIAGKVPFFVGGDHAVTIPVVEALHVLGEPIHIIQLDAHPDLYEEYEGNYYSHACTVARILEMEHVATVTQIGIRTMNPAQEKIWHKYRDRLHLISAREIVEEIPNLEQIPKTASIYLTLDLDVFDPAFVPGVSHPVPGGLSPRQVLNFIQNLQGRLVGMDVVELNSERDINQQTAILAARLLHEAMGFVVLSRD